MRKFFNTIKEISEAALMLAAGSALCGLAVGILSYYSGGTPEDNLLNIYGWSAIFFVGSAFLVGMTEIDMRVAIRRQHQSLAA